MDEVFPLFEEWGVAGVKIDFMNHDDQWVVDWSLGVIEKVAFPVIAWQRCKFGAALEE